MIIIKELKGKITMAGPGSWAFDAEAFVTDGDGSNPVYVHANWYDEFKHFSVNKQSRFDYMTGAADDEPESADLELYESIRAAKNSKYIAAIKAVDRVLNSLGVEDE